MLQIIKAKVNGKDGFIATFKNANGQLENVAFVDRNELVCLLDVLS